jgi:hypothetical protein
MAEDDDRLAEETLAWLRQEGFQEEERGESESFGDRFVRLSRGEVELSVVRDRGWWYVDIGGPGFEVGFDPYTWRTYLEGDEPPDDATSFAKQVEFLRTRVPEVEAAIERDPAIQSRLLKLRKASADRRLGL